jgi:Domain of unknown function (DUF4328)
MSAPSPARGLGKAVLAVIGLRLLLIPLFYGVNAVLFGTRPGLSLIRTVLQIENVGRLLITVLVAVLFMIWVRAEIVALRSVGIQTNTTPLMAILGWFIPFANFVFPLLAAREVYKYRLPRASGALPVVWWIAYLASMVSNNVALPFPLGILISLAAFGTWGALVYAVVMAPNEPSYGHPGQPMPFPAQQYYAPPPPRM